MSNRPAAKSGGFSAAKYRALGEDKPFPFEREDGTVLDIPRPNAGQMFDAEELQRTGQGGPRDVLRLLCGDAGPEVIAIVSDWPIEGVNAFTGDLMGYFGMGESPASSG